jgi:hypothetical protein
MQLACIQAAHCVTVHVVSPLLVTHNGPQGKLCTARSMHGHTHVEVVRCLCILVQRPGG